MLSFKDHVKEAKAYGLDPKAGDEKEFKDKHVVDVRDDPHNDAETVKGTKKSPAKKKRLADMDQDEAEKVYEEKMMKCEDCGEEYDADEGEHECEMEEQVIHEMSDAQVKKREDIVKGMKKNQAELKDRYGNKWRSVMYATATKQAMGESVGLDEISTKTLHSYMTKASDARAHRGLSTKKVDNRYAGVKKASDELEKRNRMRREELDLDEAFKVGAMKLKDGSSVKLTKEDVQALEGLYKNLNSSNRKKMQEKLETDKKSFGEILAFAKQAM